MTSHAGEIGSAQNLTRTSHIQARKMEGHLGLDDDDNSDDDGDAHGDHLDGSHNFHLRELLLLPEGSLHIRKQNKSDISSQHVLFSVFYHGCYILKWLWT